MADKTVAVQRQRELNERMAEGDSNGEEELLVN